MTPEPPTASGPGPGPAGEGRRRRGVLFGAALAVSVLLALAAATRRSGPNLPPRTIEDRAFTRRADAVCGRALPALSRERPERREGAQDARTLAAHVDRAAEGLADVVADLRALPVAAADEADVDRWLDDWDAYVAVGHRYAEALRAGDRKTFTSVAAMGDPLSRRIFLVSRANGMPRCVLQ